MIWTVLFVVLMADEPARVEKPIGEKPTAEQVRFFETNVRPIFVEHCQKCHGSTKQWGGLRLDSREALLHGGDSGAAIVSGKPNESLLMRAVRHQDENLKMPKEGKLSERQIADLARWIEMGAPFPNSPKVNDRSRDPNHWTFQPPTTPIVPVVKNGAWLQTEVDRFVLAKLEANELLPSARADKRTLIRRVTFDLTGLPPTPDEVAAFLADERGDAFAKVVDRLLDSTAYGEKWGRHWLDVARYADSNGLDENIAHGNAWRYRDYVVAAFNRDKPFDRFLVENLKYLRHFLIPAAASLLPLLLIFVQLESWFDRRPLKVGESAVVVVELDPSQPVVSTSAAISAASMAHVDSPAVRIPAQNEIAWRVVASDEGVGWVEVTIDGQTERKSFVAGTHLIRTSIRRDQRGFISQLLNPFERTLPTVGPIRRIEVWYPPREIFIGYRKLPWLAAAVLLMMAFSLVIGRVAGVRIA